MRLNRFLASAGLGSRRSCEELILSGQVTINGAMCTNLATRVEPSDVIKVGNRVMHTAAPVTILLHKLPGFVCTATDTHDRRTIFDLLPTNFPRLFHVGRLDKESEGLLLVTNDGDLSLKLTHPRYKVEKEYEVVLDKPFDFTLAEKLLHGISIPEGFARAEAVHKLGSNKVKIVLRQGLKRQIRLMFYALGYEVEKLVRTRIGPITIQGMPPGAWRVLTQREIDSLVAAGKAGASDSARPHHQPKPKKGHPEEIPFKPRASRAPEGGEAPRKFAPAPGWNRNKERPPRRSFTDKPEGKPKPAGGKTFGRPSAGGKFGSGSRPASRTNRSGPGPNRRGR